MIAQATAAVQRGDSAETVLLKTAAAAQTWAGVTAAAGIPASSRAFFGNDRHNRLRTSYAVQSLT